MNTNQNSSNDKEENIQYYDRADEDTYASPPAYYCPVYNCPYNPEMMDEEDDFTEAGDDLYRQRGRRRRRRRRRHRHRFPYSPFIFPIIFPLGDFDDWDW